MLLYHAVIPLDPRTKKNHMMIVGTGSHCPVCHKPVRQFVKQSHIHDKYEAEAATHVVNRPVTPLNEPVTVKYYFYMKTRRRVDALNLAAAADDLLVDCKVLEDDNSSIIKSHDGTRVFHDKETPRTELWIYDYKEEEDNERPEHLPNG